MPQVVDQHPASTTPLSDRVLAFVSRQDGKLRREAEAPRTALLENNLARKGVWSQSPEREQLELQVNGDDDLLGEITARFTRGQLGDLDMRITAYVLGRWQRGDRSISFTRKSVARDFGYEWGGSGSKSIEQSVVRIAEARFTGRIYEARTKRRIIRSFGIFDDVRIKDRADSIDGPALDDGEGTIEVHLSTFMLEQLEARHHVLLDWHTMQFRLATPLSRRLYVLLESEQGYVDGQVWQRTIDSALLATLDISDAKAYRVRQKLAQAGESICTHVTRYREIGVREGARRGAYVLYVKRESRKHAVA